MKFNVSVEKQLLVTGIVVVEADSADEAIAITDERIVCGELETTHPQWDDPEYEDFTFVTTGDVEETEIEGDQ